ncbi:MAG: STAS/SEC14 domain-containing protein, partial [Acidobacteriaceae bacterium]
MMPIDLREESDDRILVIHVRGRLVKQDYGPFVREFDRIVEARGKLRVLFDMTELQGWEPGAMWEDIKFDIRHLTDIDRLAMVGDKKWQQGMAFFFKPFTSATT